MDRLSDDSTKRYWIGIVIEHNMKNTYTVIGILVVCAFLTRFIGLSWGLPYPMHPDERNMAVALMDLSCTTPIHFFQVKTLVTELGHCFNPHFFAYGQLPLYIGFGIIHISKLVRLDMAPITFTEATLALRIVSSICSLLLLVSLFNISKILRSKSLLSAHVSGVVTVTMAIFSPFLIQSAHFGTTETLLMLLYSEIVRVSLLFIKKTPKSLWCYCGIILGLASAVKISAVQFGVVPFMAWLFAWERRGWRTWFHKGLVLAASAIPAYLISSPHNLLSLQEFLGSMRYELAVGGGLYKAFYTTTFEGSIPLLFQLHLILPYALGLGSFVLSIIAFLILDWKDRRITILRIALLVPLLSSAFLYTKWTRFTVLSLPLIYVLIGQMVAHYSASGKKYSNTFLLIPVIALITISIISGLAYTSIYLHEDVRVEASKWIYDHIPTGSHILSETANVVDVPLYIDPGHNPSRYDYTSFDFYNLDTNTQLQSQLSILIQQADYIIMPSRRVLANHTCFIPNGSRRINVPGYRNDICEKRKSTYPKLHEYYKELLLSGEYEKIAEFSSSPQVTILGKTLIKIPDEDAEETWSVFDHPVIRIYRRKVSKGLL